MAFTQSDLNAINEAIAGGELQVSIGDRKITYRSIEELKEARRLIQSELSSSTASLGRGLRSYHINVKKL